MLLYRCAIWDSTPILHAGGTEMTSFSSYSDKKTFFITFSKTLRKNAAQGILLTLFLTVSLHTGMAERYFSLLWDPGLEFEPLVYCIGSRWPDVVYVAFACIVFGLSAVLQALYNFRFMHVKKTVNVYYSLGMKRNTLFAGTFAGCAVTLSYSILLPFFVCALCNCSMFGSSPALWKAIAYYAFSFLAVALYPLAVSVFSMSLCGTTVEGIVCGLLLTFAPTFVYYGVYLFSDLLLAGFNCDVYLYTMNGADRVTSSFGGRFRFLDFIYPVTNEDFSDALVGYSSGVSPLPSVMYPVFFLAVFAAITFAARYAFVHKKTEKAGFLGANPRLLAASVFSLASLLIPFASDVLYGNGFGVASAVVLAIFLIGVAFGVYVAFVAVFLRSKEKVKANLRTGYIMSAALLVFMMLFITGGFGYETRIPDSERIVRAGISFTQGRGAFSNDSAFGYIGEDDTLFEHYPPEAHGEVLLQSILYGENLWAENCFVFFDEAEDKQTVLNVHELLLEEKKNRKVSWSESIIISYELENGQTLTRVYPEVTVEAMIEIQNLLCSQTYREGYVQYLDSFLQYNNRNAIIFSKNCTSMTDVNTRQGSGDIAKQNELFHALLDDIANGNLPMDFVSEDTPLGYIGITKYDTSDDWVYYQTAVDFLPYGADYIMIPVYPSMTKTLGVMEKYDLVQYFADIATPDCVFVYASPFNEKSEEAIQYYSLTTLQFDGFVTEYDHYFDSKRPHSEISDDKSYRLPPDALAVTDTDLIAQVCENTVFSSFVNQPGYFAELHYFDENNERALDVLVYVPYDEMPEELK